MRPMVVARTASSVQDRTCAAGAILD